VSLNTLQDIRVYVDLGTYAIEGRLIGLTTVAYVVKDDNNVTEMCWRENVKKIEIL
jgi:hypothetical protein